MDARTTPDQASQLVRRGRYAGCGGRLVVLRGADGVRIVGCFSCGREVATVAADPQVPQLA